MGHVQAAQGSSATLPIHSPREVIICQRQSPIVVHSGHNGSLSPGSGRQPLRALHRRGLTQLWAPKFASVLPCGRSTHGFRNPWLGKHGERSCHISYAYSYSSVTAARPFGSGCQNAARTVRSSLRQHRSLQTCQRQQVALVGAGSGNTGNGSQSVDSDEEGDGGVTRELESYETERFRSMGRHLELMWNFNQKPQPEQCTCCSGTGSRKCEYCHSTGAMMVGHERFCSLEQGCKPCPVCNGTGDVKCFHCQGTGYRAGWLDEGCPVDPGL